MLRIVAMVLFSSVCSSNSIRYLLFILTDERPDLSPINFSYRNELYLAKERMFGEDIIKSTIFTYFFTISGWNRCFLLLQKPLLYRFSRYSFSKKTFMVNEFRGCKNTKKNDNSRKSEFFIFCEKTYRFKCHLDQ